MPAVPVIIYYINEPLSFILLYMLRGYRLSFMFVQTIGYIFISFTLPLLFTLMRIIKILLLCYYVSDLSRINSSFRIRVRNPYTKKKRERERERAAYKSTHRRSNDSPEHRFSRNLQNHRPLPWPEIAQCRAIAYPRHSSNAVAS